MLISNGEVVAIATVASGGVSSDVVEQLSIKNTNCSVIYEYAKGDRGRIKDARSST